MYRNENYEQVLLHLIVQQVRGMLANISFQRVNSQTPATHLCTECTFLSISPAHGAKRASKPYQFVPMKATSCKTKPPGA